jgi:hypothetical protein
VELMRWSAPHPYGRSCGEGSGWWTSSWGSSSRPLTHPRIRGQSTAIDVGGLAAAHGPKILGRMSGDVRIAVVVALADSPQSSPSAVACALVLFGFGVEVACSQSSSHAEGEGDAPRHLRARVRLDFGHVDDDGIGVRLLDGQPVKFVNGAGSEGFHRRLPGCT